MFVIILLARIPREKRAQRAGYGVMRRGQHPLAAAWSYVELCSHERACGCALEGAGWE